MTSSETSIPGAEVAGPTVEGVGLPAERTIMRQPGRSAKSAKVGHLIPPYAGPLAALVIICVVLSIARPFFLSKDNLLNVLTTSSPLMIVALGMTLAMIGGGFDLSVGSMVAAAGIVLYLTLDQHLPAIVCVLIALVMGALIGGCVNGILIAKANLNFFVVTLGSMTALSGLVYVISNGQTNTISSRLIYNIGNGYLLGIPVPVVISVVVFLICWCLLALTPLGRNIYAIGGSREAARLSGIRVPLLVAVVYGASGLFAALAGVVQTGLLTAASPTVGGNLALTAGAAVLLGGTSFSGGVGGVTGTVVGVLLLATLQNGLGIFGIASFWQDVVTGVVLIIAVGLDQLQRRVGRR